MVGKSDHQDRTRVFATLYTPSDANAYRSTKTHAMDQAECLQAKLVRLWSYCKMGITRLWRRAGPQAECVLVDEIPRTLSPLQWH